MQKEVDLFEYSPDFLYLYPPLFRTTVVVHNRFPQVNINVQKKAVKTNMCPTLCVVPISTINSLIFVDENPLKIDEK